MVADLQYTGGEGEGEGEGDSDHALDIQSREGKDVIIVGHIQM